MRQKQRRKFSVVWIVCAITATFAVSCTRPVATPDLSTATQPPVPSSSPDVDAIPTPRVLPSSDTEGATEIVFDVGVTTDPCPDSVNVANGCIFLGTLRNDPATPLSSSDQAYLDGQRAFWQRVNEEGGIGGFDIDITTHTGSDLSSIAGTVLGIVALDTVSDPLAFAQTVQATNVLVIPPNQSALWLNYPLVLQSGAEFCITTMNALDWITENQRPIKTVLILHDSRTISAEINAGVTHWGENNEATVTDSDIASAADVSGSIEQITIDNPDTVVLSLDTATTSAVLIGAAQRGVPSTFIVDVGAYEPSVVATFVEQSITANVLVTSAWEPWPGETVGHRAMREQGLHAVPDERYLAGWISAYPLLEVLTHAANSGDITRVGVSDAVTEITSVAYEGMLPDGSGNLAGEPNGSSVRQSVVSVASATQPTGLERPVIYSGSTAERFDYETESCTTQTGN